MWKVMFDDVKPVLIGLGGIVFCLAILIMIGTIAVVLFDLSADQAASAIKVTLMAASIVVLLWWWGISAKERADSKKDRRNV